MTKRAIIYARVSTKRQADDGLPVESQVDHCRTKAAALGATVAKVFIDGGISGTTDRRPAFQDALNYCAVMEVDYFVCWASSRFARNHLQAGKYKAVLERYGTRLIYSSSEVDIRTDDGWFSDSINSLIDERYSRQVSTDTRRSMLKAARDGCFMGGRIPFGYAVVPDGKRKRLGVHPTEGPTVQAIFAMGLQGLGTKMIATQLNAQGLTIRGKPWAKNTVNYLLKNEVYAGFTVFNRVGKGRIENPRESWVRVANHVALISIEDFERAQTMMQNRQPANVGGQTRSNQVFTGLLRCGTCDASLQTCSGTGRGRVYHYYGCRDGLVGKHRCGASRIRADLFDDWMLGELLDRVITPDRMTDIIAEAQEIHCERDKGRQARRAVLVTELRSAEKSRRKIFEILEMHGKDAPNLGDLTVRLRELNERIKRLEGGLTDLENEQALPENMPQVDPEDAADYLRGIVLDCTDPKKLREFVGTFVKAITVGESEVLVDYHPECLVQLNHRSVVHSARNWLPVLGSLRTVRLSLVRPATFYGKDRAGLLTLAA